jgi:hypothetical protein
MRTGNAPSQLSKQKWHNSFELFWFDNVQNFFDLAQEHNLKMNLLYKHILFEKGNE